MLVKLLWNKFGGKNSFWVKVCLRSIKGDKSCCLEPLCHNSPTCISLLSKKMKLKKRICEARSASKLLISNIRSPNFLNIWSILLIKYSQKIFGAGGFSSTSWTKVSLSSSIGNVSENFLLIKKHCSKKLCWIKSAVFLNSLGNTMGQKRKLSPLY